MQAERQRWGQAAGEGERAGLKTGLSLCSTEALNALGVKSILLYLTSTLGSLTHRCTGAHIHTGAETHTHTTTRGGRDGNCRAAATSQCS